MITVPHAADATSIGEMMVALRTRYRFLHLIPIGHSVLGRPIEALVLGTGGERVLYAAAFHAQEWITALILLRFCERLCHTLHVGGRIADIDLRRALGGRGLMLIPLVNPDGVDIARHGSPAAGVYERRVCELGGDTPGAWQANVRGVDLNHNFPAGWDILRRQEIAAGITGPAPRRFGGDSPESEPETAALTALCRHASFRHAIALHSQGEEIYWRYGEHTPPRSRLMAEIMAASSGYALGDPEGLASHGGFKDWFIEECRRPAFTVELGKGVNPLPLTAFDGIYRKVEEMLVLAALM